MAFNGSGTYVLPGPALSTGGTVSATEHNTFRNDVATALTNCVTRDGQSPATANLPMGGFKHTGVAASAALTDYARTDQIQNGSFTTLSSVSGADTITATATPAPSAYAAGQRFSFVSAGANTTAVTLNVNSLGAKAVTKNGTTALAAGDIASGIVVVVEYDGTQFQLINNASIVAAHIANTSNPHSVTAAQAGAVPSTGTTGSAVMPSGTTAQRDGSPVTGYTRHNSTRGVMEWYNGATWEPFGPSAWCTFNGTGTVALIDGFNVTSITDNGTGDYTVNFTTALADANYAAIVSSDAQTGWECASYAAGAKSTTALNILTYSNGVAADSPFVYLATFGGV